VLLRFGYAAGVLPVFRLAVAVVDDLEALEGEEGVNVLDRLGLS
jgi:hypothetical protein